MDPQVVGGVDEGGRRVVLVRDILADPAVVWRGLTEPAGIAAWLGRYEGPRLGLGTRFTIWHDGLVPSSHTVVEWLPPTGLTMTWDFPDEAPSRVRIVVEAASSGSKVVLEHEGVEDPVSYSAGWHVHLDFLAGFAEGRPRSFEQFWDDYEELLQTRPRAP